MAATKGRSTKTGSEDAGAGDAPADLITFSEVAKMLQTNLTTVRRMADRGKLGPVYRKQTDRRVRLVTQSAAEALQRQLIEPEKPKQPSQD